MRDGKRILLGNNIGSGALTLLPIRFQHVKVRISTGSLIVRQVFKNGVMVI
jgi:hypothetical protein